MEVNKSSPKRSILTKMLSPKGSAFRISLFYLLYGVIWILTTDRFLNWMVGGDHETYNQLQTYKGWIYVALTATFIYALVARTLSLYEVAKKRVQSAKDELQDQYERTLTSEKRFDLAVKGSFDSIWEYDGIHNQYFMSKAIMIALGYEDTMKLETLEDWMSYIIEEDRDVFRQHVERFTNAPTDIFEASYRVYRKDGTIAWIRTRGSSLIDQNGKILKVAGSHTDITLYINHQEELTKIAYYDRLTGLLNRHGFSQKIKERIEKSPKLPFTIMELDIDDFKNINDFYGYSIGDKLLVAIGNMLKDHLEGSDHLSNLGGDGFGFLIESTDKTYLFGKIKRIYESLNSIPMIDGRLIEVNACIGLAQYPNDEKDVQELLYCADEAMYEAKNKGKNTYVFYTGALHQSHLSKIALTNQLRKAVDNNELLMMYQPIYKLSDHSLSSMEALIRWFPKDQDPVSPDIFIPLAETSGLISKIELWVFEDVFKQVVAWRKIRSRNIPIAINLSSKGLTDEDFMKSVIELIDKYNIKPGEIEIEITETSLIESGDVALKHIGLLSSQGIRILLDDFGKGYSSLTYLVSLPIDVLKIDRGFTQQIHSSYEINEVIATIINLAHAINLKVIAEGIEYENQKEFLKSLGTDYGQGYYLHVPALPIDLEQLLH
ncbi:MAG: PAS domain S-box/diguanylate cyclase (GGDEF) domain-containing protein [Erysipelotrichaceae bacterium]|nr:MAG: PAS domain S-box/diguanylate cyclase (GGDEF) domain-containing [Erysipelotrichaceae bacterium]TXT17316.1 MAG: PAS domain S-box/diguanylate cyclase (GGDEF) domain-containing protein [Erysipelotrichaceae bacterium]